MLLLGLVEVPTWLLLGAAVTVLLYLYGTRNFNEYKGSGLRGPRPLPFIGTFGQFMRYGIYDVGRVLKEKYGNVVVLFNGNSPNLFIYDQELVHQFMVKRFAEFSNRQAILTGDEVFDSMLLTLEDEPWKRVRSAMSPSFTTGRLKAMNNEINRCARQFANNIRKNTEPVDLFHISGCFTMDVIASTAFGLRVNSQDEEKNAFVVYGKKLTDFDFRNPVLILAVLFPSLMPYITKLGYGFFDQKAQNFFVQVFEETLKNRQGGDKTRNDFLQLMANAQKGEKIHDDKDDGELEHLDGKSNPKGISKNEILGNALVFFLAGYDTTNVGLTQLLYCLTVNPECQNKVFEEIETHVGDKEDIDYETVSKLEYLDQCLQESLRLYPAAPFIDRVAKVDTELGGIKIKKGRVVNVPVYAIHHDPEIWPEPEKFDPDRFTPEAKQGRSPTVWLPFGLGPRNCIGMRLAIMEIKIAVAQLLRTHKLVPCEKTEIPIKFSKGKWLKSINGVWATAEKR